jgi:hypothetical protein
MCDISDLAVWLADCAETYVDEPDPVFRGDLRIRLRGLLTDFIARVDEWPDEPAPVAALAQAALAAVDDLDDELVSRLTDRLAQLASEHVPFPQPDSAPESPA